MPTTEKILTYRKEVETELHHNILPFWERHGLDRENQGFYGHISNDLIVDKEVEKGCVLNSRILWTYASAYRLTKDPRYLEMAKRAYEFMLNHFWDKEYSGLYWMVDFKGNPVDTQKRTFNLAFGIYALAELYAASGIFECLDKAVELYKIIEAKGYDHENKGYLEAFSREWLPADDCRLSVTDLNGKRSLNTHLHIIEAYTNLLRVWENAALRERLKELLMTLIDNILDSDTFHFKLYLDENWHAVAPLISYGHDIEGSWLMCESAQILNDKNLLDKVKDIAVVMAQRVYDQGLDNDYGGLYYESLCSVIDTDKHWWPQAEAMIGFLNAYELTGKECFFEASLEVWRFIKNYIIDTQNGEWFAKVSKDGRVFYDYLKVGPWKCPYHNSRACFEVLERLARLAKSIPDIE